MGGLYSVYIFFAVIFTVAVPLMFPRLKWYFIIVAYLLALALSFYNYDVGLIDINMAYNCGKVALFILTTMSSKNDAFIIGVIGYGLIKSMVSISSNLMHDFKTGHLAFTSPQSMLLTQAIGMSMGCVVAPLCFFLFYKAFDVGNFNGEYRAPHALMCRNMAILDVKGFFTLPQQCLELCYEFFTFVVIANLIRDVSPKRADRWLPPPMVVVVSFLVRVYFSIDMCVGNVMLDV
ncbi:metal-nicotianamine transporter YSL3-like [Prosopis cineraria]|uniref:metal-nicotianamine transporter YSL3-like n=1 Tax=Prosopis cineraria TaxID=364024 RepID=UPI00240F0BB6|nr:metal-nicotianamine transporter YSL3-like [Prosopis cineraria]